MKLFSVSALVFAWIFIASAPSAYALVEGAISGSITDAQGIAIPNVVVQVKNPAGSVVKQVEADPTGNYTVFPLTLGDYSVTVQQGGFAPYSASVHVASGSTTSVDIQLQPPVQGKEMVLKVEAKRHQVQTSTATSSKEISSEEIKELPQGDNISLPHLLASTNPGIVQGPFGQTFIRGNHANIQYQIDGVQLPDSETNTFGDQFTPRNIDHMEVITGGVPAEYGNRLAAVINIVTKSGPETPSGEAEVNYGSYNTFQPWAIYGGSNEKGDLHYFFSAQYTNTDRGLDTPQPQNDGGTCGFSCGNQSAGGTEAVHDSSNGNNEFFKIDWLPDNDNKFSVIGFNNYTYYELPNYPSNFLPTDQLFQPTFTDTLGNANPNAYFWSPYYTNDNQADTDTYAELVWKHSFTDHSFFQQAAYYKYSNIRVNSDPTNDLLMATYVPGVSGTASSASLFESRHVNNVGLKGDFTDRINDRNLLKAGYQLQDSIASGALNVETASNDGTPTGSTSTISGYNGNFPTYTPTFSSTADNSTATGLTESVYAQNDFTITKQLVLNVGLRFDAIQYYFRHTPSGDVTSTDNQIEPRIGLNYFVGQYTKLHAFYGRLFQPAPLEDLRDTFVGLNLGNPLEFYDIKAEKDNYYEGGIAQQIGTHVVNLNGYYKSATDMLDDTGLLNTSIAAAYNYQTGYAYGVELSEQGQLASNWSDYANYSYEIAKGQGASGGLFAVPQSQLPTPGVDYFLDHVQIHTANAGVVYSKDRIRWATQGLFGSGLRTGPNNSVSMPSHFTMDTSVGYDFHGDSWLTKTKVSFDMLNIFNNGYPITFANGYNGAHYAPGREYFVHLTKEL
jgi:outer membrane receptor for ferrienterochelin and colicin